MLKMKFFNLNDLLIFPAIISLLLMDGCIAYDYTIASRDVEVLAPGILEGYIPYDELPNSLELLPLPPEEGSAAFEHDMEMSTASLQQMDTTRFMQAASDANLAFPGALDDFNALIDFNISEESSPYLYLLLRRTLTDASLSTYAAKSYYKRARPFMVNNLPTCTPQAEEQLRKDGSYPSGHAAIGWAWALILSEVFPERTDAILLRGRQFAESRYVCNVHWYSDVIGGQFMGTATVALLHGNDIFQHDLKKAKREIKILKDRGN